jgi:transposase-like protein
MDVGMFSTWLDGVVALTHGQRQQTFMMLALREAEDETDLVAGGAGVSSEAPAVITARLADGAPSPAAPSSPPAISDGKLDALTAAAVRRLQMRGCPHCDAKEVRPWGRAHGLARYRCTDCRRTFNALSGTPLARLRHKDRWSDQAGALMTGESVAEAAGRCGVAYSTAFRWRHRFLAAPALDKPLRLNGIVEADETFILESFKGRRADLPRAARTRGGKPTKTGLSAEQIPVLVARDRTGATIDAVLPKLDRASVTAVLSGVVTPANQLCIDGGKAIAAFARVGGIPYHVLPQPGGPQPGAPELHINNVNAYHSRLKEWLRRFHGVATKNLSSYLGWRRTLEAFGHRKDPSQWLDAALGTGTYQQVTL